MHPMLTEDWMLALAAWGLSSRLSDGMDEARLRTSNSRVVGVVEFSQLFVDLAFVREGGLGFGCKSPSQSYRNPKVGLAV